LVRGHGIRTSQHDGQLVEAVDRATAETIAHVRDKGGPALLEFMTYRWLEHCGPLGDIQLGYRTHEELDTWVVRCPIRLHQKMLERDGLIDEATGAAMDREIAAEIDDAVAFAQKSPFPDRTQLTRHLFA
jgi:pyruvate dehydrogenase E1 component alpha subunit